MPKKTIKVSSSYLGSILEMFTDRTKRAIAFNDEIFISTCCIKSSVEALKRLIIILIIMVGILIGLVISIILPIAEDIKGSVESNQEEHLLLSQEYLKQWQSWSPSDASPTIKQKTNS